MPRCRILESSYCTFAQQNSGIWDSGSSTAPWTKAKVNMALKHGPHRSSHNGIDVLRTEYVDMMDKQQWIVIPASTVKNIKGLRLSSLGLVPQQNRRN